MTVLRVARWPYRRIAHHHRRRAGRVDRFGFRRETAPLHAAVVRATYLRALGLVYLMAFTSLRAQVLGLYGRRGVAPIAELVAEVRETLGRRGLHVIPSIFWLDASDRTLVRACRLGQGLSLTLICGTWPRPNLFALWVLYMSFVTAGSEFLSYQWDTLLLESTVHALFVASPRSVRSFPLRRREDPSWLAIALMRALAVRFFYEAGISKLRSGDATWKELTACSYHYETQPLPTPMSWRTHHLPQRVQRLSTMTALLVECLAPFAALGPRRVRRAGFVALALLQSAIAVTGNYGFFNVLSITVALWLLDDASLPSLLAAGPAPQRARGLERAVAATGFALLVPTAATVHGLRYWKREGPRWFERIALRLEAFRSTGAYGLFSVMTRRRLEIVIEGSEDREEWLPYEFVFKPGDPHRMPRWAAPHQPRLDWQMWFAALGPPPAWFLLLLIRLLQKAPEVERLLERTPFPDHPPKYVRAWLYEYRLSDREMRRKTGDIWQRRRLGLYVPPLALAD